MEQEFIQKLKETLEIDDRDLNMDDEFRDYPEWDSLNYLMVIALFDEEYDIQIEEAEFKNFRTVGDLFKATQN